MTWLSDIIASVKLLFIKDRELYAFLHGVTGWWPRRIDLYKLALIHRSKPVRGDDGKWINNERLEFLGDAVLDLVVADFLYKTYPEQSEGFLTNTRAKIVQRESLNRIGSILHIDTHVRAGAHSTSHNSYICGNAMEAIVGALYLDRGYRAAERFIVYGIIKAHFNLDELIATEQNHKSRLIEWTQKFRVPIDYELLDTLYDEENNIVFKTGITLAGIYAADGVGYSKKESHQNASRKVLERLEQDSDFRNRVMSARDHDADTAASL